jgi:hypothetical protein
MQRGTMKKEAITFWVTNMCDRNVSLADLNVTIPAFRSVNLLDNRHYYYTLEQLQKSQQSGSLFIKRRIISVRQSAPAIIKSEMPFLQEAYLPTRERSTLEIKEEHYEELEMTDMDQKKKEEEFAKEHADFAEIDDFRPFTTTNKG